MRLENWRKQKDLSYENLARALNFTTSKTYRICKGVDNCIRLHEAYKIIKLTANEVSYHDLLEDMEDC
jgi:hypothetical protein